MILSKRISSVQYYIIFGSEIVLLYTLILQQISYSLQIYHGCPDPSRSAVKLPKKFAKTPRKDPGKLQFGHHFSRNIKQYAYYVTLFRARPLYLSRMIYLMVKRNAVNSTAPRFPRSFSCRVRAGRFAPSCRASIKNLSHNE